MKIHVEGARARAIGSGLAIARFFGANSPKTIWPIVASTSAIASEIPNVADSGIPTASSSGSIAPAIAGSATKPSTKVVTVMPSCAPDSMKLSLLCTAMARVAFRSPNADCS